MATASGSCPSTDVASAKRNTLLRVERLGAVAHSGGRCRESIAQLHAQWRRLAALRAAVPLESLDVRTSDGWSLRADVRIAGRARARGRRARARAHGAAHGVLSQPGVELRELPRRPRLARRRLRLPRPRRERPGAARGRLVTGTTTSSPATSRPCAPSPREQAGRTSRVVVVGHSLGGHAAFVGAGNRRDRRRRDRRDRRGAPRSCATTSRSRARWLLKRAVFASMLATARRVGRFPARALRLGSDDEALALLRGLRARRADRPLDEPRRTHRLPRVARERARPRPSGRERARPLRVRPGVRRALRRVLRRASRGRARRARRTTGARRRATWASSRAAACAASGRASRRGCAARPVSRPDVPRRSGRSSPG